MKRFFPFLIILPVLFSCNKNEDNTYKVTEYISDNIKSLVFKPGSYWIYKSDSSGLLDSTWVDQLHYGFYEIGYGLDRFVDYEYYSDDFLSNSPDGPSKYKNLVEMHHMLMDPTIRYPNAWGPVLYTYDTNDWIDSVKIGINTFHNVETCKFTLNSHITTYYTDPYVGLIRKDIIIDSTLHQWDLIRWQIIK